MSLTVEVGLLEEEDGADGPSGAQGNEQGRPVAALSPQPEQPEMMLEDNEGKECFEDDEVQFVSETGAGQTSTSPSASGSSKVKRSLLVVRTFVLARQKFVSQYATISCTMS